MQVEMNITLFDIAYHGCLISCAIATLVLGIQSLNKYLLDENSTRVNHIKFNHDNVGNIYPSVTLCVLNPFLEKELKRYREDINITTYFKFLKGKIWDREMMDIDYDRVTVSLTDNLIGVKMRLANGSDYRYDHVNGKQSPSGWKPHFYVARHLEEQHSILKCFSFEIPFIDKAPVAKYQIYLKKALFPQQYQNQLFKFEHNASGMILQFHYPGQRIATKITVGSWSRQTKKRKLHTLGVKLFGVNVMIYRNRKKEPCIGDWLNYDQIITDEQVMRAGCRPRFWTTDKTLPECNTQLKIDRFNNEMGSHTNWKSRPPCRVIRAMQYIHTDEKYSENVEASDAFFGFAGSIEYY